MLSVLGTITLRLALCVGLSAAVFHWFGPVALVTTLPLYGIALARPLLDLIGEMHHEIKRIALRDIEGSHYAYRQQAIRILLDDEGLPWLRTVDLRKMLTGLPADRLLGHLYGSRCTRHQRDLFIRADALEQGLSKTATPSTADFLHWLRSAVQMPARRARENIDPP